MSGKTWGDFYKFTHRNKETLEGNICNHIPFIKEIAKYLVPGTKILEIGTGTGVLAMPLLGADVAVVSIDNDPDILRMAKDNAAMYDAKITYLEADAFALPFKEREFRVSFSLGLLEHFTNKEIGALIKEHQRVADVVVVGMPLKGNTGGAFGNERYLNMAEWEEILMPMGVHKGFIYGEEPICCFTFISVEGNKIIPKRGDK
jgi:hypothetical protein